MTARGLWGFGFLLAIGLSVLGYFASQIVINGRIGVNVATVKGLSERLVEADKVTWVIPFSVNRAGDKIDKAAFYQQSKDQRTQIYDVLLDTGFTKEEIFPSAIQLHRTSNTNRDGEIVHINNKMSGTIKLVTSQLSLMTEAVENIAALIADGIEVNARSPQYTFTNLNDIKPEMLREATANARIAAEQFALNAGVRVGGLQTAYQGGFTIRDANNERTDKQEPMKRVRVVTTVTFYLKN